MTMDQDGGFQIPKLHFLSLLIFLQNWRRKLFRTCLQHQYSLCPCLQRPCLDNPLQCCPNDRYNEFFHLKISRKFEFQKSWIFLVFTNIDFYLRVNHRSPPSSEPRPVDPVSKHVQTGLLPVSTHNHFSVQRGCHDGPICLQYNLYRRGCEG